MNLGAIIGVPSIPRLHRQLKETAMTMSENLLTQIKRRKKEKGDLWYRSMIGELDSNDALILTMWENGKSSREIVLALARKEYNVQAEQLSPEIENLCRLIMAGAPRRIRKHFGLKRSH